MATDKKNFLRNVMAMAWQFVKKNGFSMSEALKTAWLNAKLRSAMKTRIVKFYFNKVDGTIREAYGTLVETMLPPVKNDRKPAPSVQVYYDTEKQEYRCFKKANLLRMI